MNWDGVDDCLTTLMLATLCSGMLGACHRRYRLGIYSIRIVAVVEENLAIIQHDGRRWPPHDGKVT